MALAVNQRRQHGHCLVALQDAARRSVGRNLQLAAGDGKFEPLGRQIVVVDEDRPAHLGQALGAGGDFHFLDRPGTPQRDFEDLRSARFKRRDLPLRAEPARLPVVVSHREPRLAIVHVDPLNRQRVACLANEANPFELHQAGVVSRVKAEIGERARRKEGDGVFVPLAVVGDFKA